MAYDISHDEEGKKRFVFDTFSFCLFGGKQILAIKSILFKDKMNSIRKDNTVLPFYL